MLFWLLWAKLPKVKTTASKVLYSHYASMVYIASYSYGRMKGFTLEGIALLKAKTGKPPNLPQYSSNNTCAYIHTYLPSQTFLAPHQRYGHLLSLGGGGGGEISGGATRWVRRCRKAGKKEGVQLSYSQENTCEAPSCLVIVLLIINFQPKYCFSMWKRGHISRCGYIFTKVG